MTEWVSVGGGRSDDRSCHGEGILLAFMLQKASRDPRLLPLMLLALCGVAAHAHAAAQQAPAPISGIVTHVADGDTLDVTANGRAYTIRLDGIDAPEAGQAFSRQARQQLRVLAFSRPATVILTDHDRYGRVVGRVIVAGVDVGEEMVRQGLAWHYTQYLVGPAPRRAGTTGAAAAPRPLDRFEGDRALAVSQRARRPAHDAARPPPGTGVIPNRPLPRQRLEPRLSRRRLPGLQLQALHARLRHARRGGGGRLPRAQGVRGGALRQLAVCRLGSRAVGR